jgi:hypothetical protein
MKVSVSVTSYSVQKDFISVKINVKDKSEAVLDRFAEMKGKSKSVKLDDLYLPGVLISSINITTKLSLTVRATRQSFMVNKLFFLMEREPLEMFVNTNLEDDLADYLAQAHKEQKRPKEDILYEVTSYVKRGKPYEGKRSIYDLSARHQEVALDKLRKIIGAHQKETHQNNKHGGTQNVSC